VLGPITPEAAADRVALRQAEHDLLLEGARVLLECDGRVAAAWLIGSRGRGDADALSDIDLVVVAHDEHLESMKEERRALVGRLGAPLLVQDLPRNAPPGGAYLLVLYPGETGPLHIDWYWRGLTGAAVPHDARLLFERSPVSMPRQPRPAPPSEDERALDAARAMVFFWAMAPIAAKYIARRRPLEAFDLLRSMDGAIVRARAAIRQGGDRSWAGDAESNVEKLLTADGGVQVAVLRGLCEEMVALLDQVGSLRREAGALAPEAPRHVLAFVELVGQLVARD